jgi:HetE-like protein
MEPITFTAIVAALSAGVAAGVGKVGESALVDAYQGLKAALKRKFGDQSEVVEAVDMLEKRPDSEGRRVTLKEEVERAKVDEDPDLKQAAQELLDRLKAQPGGEQHIQSAIGSYIAQADRGSTATVNVDRPAE